MPNRVKIYHKGSVWSHHGRHRGMLAISIMRNRKPSFASHVKSEPMFNSVSDMFAHYARRK